MINTTKASGGPSSKFKQHTPSIGGELINFDKDFFVGVDEI
jgi:hypothetical protein